VKYRDLLLKRDAVTTLQRRLHAQRLAASGGEAGEVPPAALTAHLRLSAAERERVVEQLNAALGGGDVQRYRRLAEGLYRNGVISAGDLSSCLVAAAVAAEAAAAAEVGGKGDDEAARDALFAAISGGGSGISGAAAAAAAQAVWDAAAQRVERDEGAAAITLDEARRLWSGLLSRAGQPGSGGLQLEEMLAAAADGSSAAGGAGAEALSGRLSQLQGALQQAVAAGGGASTPASSSSSGSGETGSWQERLWRRTSAAAASSGSAAADTAAGNGGDLQRLDFASLHEKARLEMEAVPPVPPPYPGEQ